MLFGGIINDIFSGLFSIVLSIVNVVLTPIYWIIGQLIPGLDGALAIMNQYIQIVGDYISFALSYLGFYPDVIAAGCLLLTSIIMIPFTVHSIKLVVMWYNALKP